MKDPDTETPAQEPEIARNEVSFSMLAPTAILAIGLFIIGFANAVIVSILTGFFPM